MVNRVTVPNFSQYNFSIGDTTEVVTKQNGVNAALQQFGNSLNASIDQFNDDVEFVDTARQELDTDNIVHAPGSGLPNEAGDAYSRDVGESPGDVLEVGAFGLGAGGVGGFGVEPGPNGIRDIPGTSAFVHSQSNAPGDTPYASQGAGLKIGGGDNWNATLWADISSGRLFIKAYDSAGGESGWFEVYTDNNLTLGTGGDAYRNNSQNDSRYAQQDGNYANLRARGTTAADVGAPPTSRTISAGAGLTGGGSLASNRTLSVDSSVARLGTNNSQVRTNSQNDSRFLRSVPNHSASLLTSGTIPNARIGNNAITSSRLTSSERMTTSNVLSANSGASAGAVGTYAFAEAGGGANHGFGTTTGGSGLSPGSVGSSGEYFTGSLSGTWRCLGSVSSSADGNPRFTLWLRIS